MRKGDVLRRRTPSGVLVIHFQALLLCIILARAVKPDGKIVVGGSFSGLGGETRNNIGRLNPDGSVDLSFNPGASALVYCLALQADGRILAGGVFTSLGGAGRNYLGRLLTDG